MSCHATVPPSNCTCVPTPPPTPHFVLGHASRYMLLPTVILILICLFADEKCVSMIFTIFFTCELPCEPCLQASHTCPIST